MKLLLPSLDIMWTSWCIRGLSLHQRKINNICRILSVESIPDKRGVNQVYGCDEDDEVFGIALGFKWGNFQHGHKSWEYLKFWKNTLHYIVFLVEYIWNSKIRSGDVSASDSLVRCPAGGPTFLLLRSWDVEAGVAGERHLGAVQHGRVRVGQLASCHTGVTPTSSFTFNN